MILSPILSRYFPYTFHMFFLHIFQHYLTFLGLLPRFVLQVPLFSVLNALAAVLGARFLGAVWPGACVCEAQSGEIYQEIWGFEPWLINLGVPPHEGFHKWRYPKMDGLKGTVILKWMI